IARRAAGAAACSAQRSDGGGGTFHFVLAVLDFSTSRATSGCRIWDLGLRNERIPECDSDQGREITRSNPQSEIRIPKSLRPAHSYLTLKRYGFRMVWIDVHCARRVLSGFAEISAFEEDSTKQDVGDDYSRVPENCGLQSGDCGFLLALPLLNSAPHQKTFGIRRLYYKELWNLGQCLIISTFVVMITNLIEQFLRAVSIGFVDLLAAAQI